MTDATTPLKTEMQEETTVSSGYPIKKTQPVGGDGYSLPTTVPVRIETSDTTTIVDGTNAAHSGIEGSKPAYPGRVVGPKETELRVEAAAEKAYRDTHADSMSTTAKIGSVLKETGELLAADWEATKTEIAAGPTDVKYGKFDDTLII